MSLCQHHTGGDKQFQISRKNGRFAGIMPIKIVPADIKQSEMGYLLLFI